MLFILFEIENNIFWIVYDILCFINLQTTSKIFIHSVNWKIILLIIFFYLISKILTRLLLYNNIFFQEKYFIYIIPINIIELYLLGKPFFVYNKTENVLFYHNNIRSTRNNRDLFIFLLILNIGYFILF